MIQYNYATKNSVCVRFPFSFFSSRRWWRYQIQKHKYHCSKQENISSKTYPKNKFTKFERKEHDRDQ